MNKLTRPSGKVGIVLCSALLAYTGYGQPSVEVGVSVPLPSIEVNLPSVEIHAESDFYEPLAPQGEWVVVGSYGRCWRPARVARDWRPYCNGNWERTEAGWYWVSDEPWAWATYHYGRWDFTDEYGWYWVPQTQWAPAWVSWHEGGGYVGWAPLQPSVRVSGTGFVGFDDSHISPRAFVFVQQGQFLDPIRPPMVVVNNTTVINKTVNITKTKIVNNTVINEGPVPAVIEKASGRKVQAVAVRALRHKTEATFVAQQRTTSSREKKVQRAQEQTHPETTTTVPHESAIPAAKNYEEPSDKHQPVQLAPEFNPEARPEGNPNQPYRQPPQARGKQGGKPTKPLKEEENKHQPQ